MELSKAIKSLGRSTMVIKRLYDIKAQIMGLGSEYVDRATLDMLAWYAKEYIGSQDISKRLIGIESKYPFEFEDDDHTWIKPALAQQAYVISLINHMISHISVFGIIKRERLVFFRSWSDREVVLSVLTLCVSVFLIGRWIGEYEIAKRLAVQSISNPVQEHGEVSGNIFVDSSLHDDDYHHERKDTSKNQGSAPASPSVPIIHHK